MGGDSSKSAINKIVPLNVKEVTAACITALKATPVWRRDEGHFVPADILPNLLIPQSNESSFLRIFVTERILKEDNKLDIVSVGGDFFSNYTGRVFEIEQNGVKQLLLVGLSNDYAMEEMNFCSFPFLVYIPPSPQDSPEDHKKKHMDKYAKTALNNIPYFYKDVSNYPYSWDWLYFQIYLNMYKLSYQLKKANRPYVFVVPLVKNFSDELGFLNSAILLERCLLGIQKFYLDERFKADTYFLQDIKHVTFAAFSIGNSILSNFMLRNRETPFFRNRVKDFIVLDPPPGNLKNRSSVIDTIISVLRGDTTKSVFLYAEDAYYIQPLIQSFLVPKKISFNLSKEKIFSNPQLQNLFFAYIESTAFANSTLDPKFGDVHNTFPNLFINNAVTRSSLNFRSFNGKLTPDFGFP